MDSFKENVTEICENNYDSDSGNSYIARNDNVYNVRTNILSHISNEEMRKNKYLDACTYILQFGDDVYITID